MPLKVLVGLFLVSSVMVPSLNVIYNNIFDMALNSFSSFMEGVAPVVPDTP
jgi:flagellar biosynthesis protein FliR